MKRNNYFKISRKVSKFLSKKDAVAFLLFSNYIYYNLGRKAYEYLYDYTEKILFYFYFSLAISFIALILFIWKGG